MKQLVQLGILSNLLISSAAFAVNNPVQGFYLGIMAEVSHGPASNQLVFVQPPPPSLPATTFTGKVTYSSVGGGGGATLGYKLSSFRLEGEILYNRISTGPLKVGSCTLESPNVITPTGVCPAGTYDSFQARGLGYSGSSAVVYGLVNVYYDFISSNTETNAVPYVGIGIGRAQIRNFSDFIATAPNGSPLSNGGNVTFTSSAAQGILGVSYFMDDFTWAGMDLRYTTTKSAPQLQDAASTSKNYALTSLNFNINFAFDKGGFNLG